MKLTNQFDISHIKKNLSVAIWRYTDSVRNSEGLHLSISEESKHKLISLLNFLITNYSLKHTTIDLVNATEDITSIPNYGHKIKSFNKLKLICTEGNQNIHTDGDSVFFEINKDNFLKLIECIKSVRSGYEKNIKIENEVINFWWQLIIKD
jgi:hypothetical protein